MPKKDFTARAEQDLYALASTYDETQPRKGIRAGTRGLTGARMIAIERLRVDPNQPRKTHSEDGIRGLILDFVSKESLELLAEGLLAFEGRIIGI